MKYLLPVVFLVLSIMPSQAQETAKLDLHTTRMLNSKEWTGNTINLFVKGDKEAVRTATERNGGHFKYGYGNVHAVTIPLDKLNSFLNDPAVVKAENGDIPMVALSDTAIVQNNVKPVHDGISPLSQPYKGDGVLVGIIDGGIYFQHDDFKKPNGDTRIRYLWDQTAANTGSPAPYNYGRQWNEFEINAGTCTQTEQNNQFGHGTHVAGIACGDDTTYSGMAPNAEMIVVNFNYSKPFLSTFADAVDYIFKKADAMGKPCVINASLGTYVGSHDGKDLAAELIDNLLEERGGRALVAALGNAGQIKMHLGYEVTADTAFTWFKLNPTEGDIFYQLWADTVDMDSVWFSVGADDPNSHFYFGNVGFHNIKTDYPLVTSGAATSQIRSYVLYDGTTFIGTCSTQVTKQDSRYLLEILVQPAFNSHYWRFITTGKGKFDIWSSRQQMNFADMIAVVPDPLLNATYIHYRQPDTLKTLVSSFTCSDKVISVGNFVNRKQYVDVYGDTIRFNVNVGELYKDDRADTLARLGSSYGPTRDGRLKPDISAPGGIVLATGNIPGVINAAMASGNPANYEKVALGGRHWRNSGTSMASPMVAGSVALYLQMHPTANWREIKDAFIMSARKDTFTTQTPNIAYGHGKLNTFAAMQMQLTYGCMDTASINYDATANMDDGGCISKVYGCMDTEAENYNANANVAADCLYDTLSPIGINTIRAKDAFVGIYPNPSTGNTTIYYQVADEMVGNAKLVITDLLGRETSTIAITQTKTYLPYTIQAKGVYLYHLEYGDKVYSRKKLIIY